MNYWITMQVIAKYFQMHLLNLQTNLEQTYQAGAQIELKSWPETRLSRSGIDFRSVLVPVLLRLLPVVPWLSDRHLSRDIRSLARISFSAHTTAAKCGGNVKAKTEPSDRRNVKLTTTAAAAVCQSVSLSVCRCYCRRCCCCCFVCSCWCHKSLSTTNIRWHSGALSSVAPQPRILHCIRWALHFPAIIQARVVGRRRRVRAQSAGPMTEGLVVN